MSELTEFCFLSDHSPCSIDSHQFNIILCFRYDLQRDLCDLPGNTIDVLGDIQMPAVADSLAYHRLDSGDQCPPQVNIQ